MKKFIIFTFCLALVFVFNSNLISIAQAETFWDVTGTYTWTVLGTYVHDIEITTQNPDGTFIGTGGYPAGQGPDYTDPGETPEIISGQVVGNNITFTTTYSGPYNQGYTVTVTGTIAPDGSISGTSPWNWEMTAGKATLFNRHAEITSPQEDEIVYNQAEFAAWLVDNDEDYVDWAVRKGTCAAGTNTVLGNVDGHSDMLTMTYNPSEYKYSYSIIADISGWDAGKYCFIFNPREDAGETNIRLTREFYVADTYVNGGGHLLEETGAKRKDWNDISFGGWTANLGLSGLVGEWQVNLHNVSGTELDKGKFHGTEIIDLNLFAGNSGTCNDAMNLTVFGTWNGEPGYKMILRAGDFGSPNTADTVRVEIYHGTKKRYDTYSSDFTAESTCVGNARTGLDTGNITIWQK